MCLEGYHQLIGCLLDVDEVKNLTKRINITLRVKVLVNVLYHFEPLSLKPGLFNKRIAHWKLEIEVKKFFPLGAGNRIVWLCNEGLGSWAWPEWSAMYVGVNDCFSLDSQILVPDILQSHIRRLVLNGSDMRWWMGTRWKGRPGDRDDEAPGWKRDQFKYN